MFKRVISSAVLCAVLFTGCESPTGSSDGDSSGGDGFITPRDSIDIHITRAGASSQITFFSPQGDSIAHLDALWAYNWFRTIHIPHYKTVTVASYGRYDTVYSTLQIVKNGLYSCLSPSMMGVDVDEVVDIYAHDTLDIEALGW